jgi:hypothetical protein
MVVHFSGQSQSGARLPRPRAAVKPLIVGLTAASILVAQASPVSASEPAHSSVETISAGPAGGLSNADTEAIDTDAAPLVLAIVAAVIAGGGFADQMGRNAGARVYYAGVTMSQYQEVRWQTRATAIAALGVVMGPIFMSSFESTFYGLAA